MHVCARMYCTGLNSENGIDIRTQRNRYFDCHRLHTYVHGYSDILYLANYHHKYIDTLKTILEKDINYDKNM